MKTQLTALVATVALLASCSGGDDPADPPTSQDALTTTSDTAPTTSTGDTAPTTAPPDDTEATSAPDDDATATTEADGAPEMPEEAKEDSEAGAAAFATHYLDTLNYSTMTPASGLLSGLVDESCETCTSFEGLVEQYTSKDRHSEGPVVTFQPLEARATGETTVIFADATQPVPATLDSDGNVVLEGGESTAFTMVIRLHRVDDAWRISEIQAQR